MFPARILIFIYFSFYRVFVIFQLTSTSVSNYNLLFCVQAASMFKGPVPPIVPFSLGSLGFMTPFRILTSVTVESVFLSVYFDSTSITVETLICSHLVAFVSAPESFAQKG